MGSLRDSFALHLGHVRSPKTARIYLAALDGLIRHLEAQGMPTGARSVRREHVESYFGEWRRTLKPATLSLEFRALQQFSTWALDEEEIERSPMERMKVPAVPDSPVPLVSVDDFKLHVVSAQRLAGWKSPLMLRRYGASLADERARAAYKSRATPAPPPARPMACWGTPTARAARAAEAGPAPVSEHQRCREIATKSAEAIEVSRA